MQKLVLIVGVVVLVVILYLTAGYESRPSISPPSQVCYPNKNATFSCYGGVSEFVVWLFTNGSDGKSKSLPRNGSFYTIGSASGVFTITIDCLSELNNSEIRCQDGSSGLDSEPVRMIVQEPLALLPEKQSCHHGEYVKFECSGGNSSHYSWKRNNKTLPLNSDEYTINGRFLNISCQNGSEIECIDASNNIAAARLIIEAQDVASPGMNTTIEIITSQSTQTQVSDSSLQTTIITVLIIVVVVGAIIAVVVVIIIVVHKVRSKEKCYSLEDVGTGNVKDNSTSCPQEESGNSQAEAPDRGIKQQWNNNDDSMVRKRIK